MGVAGDRQKEPMPEDIPLQFETDFVAKSPPEDARVNQLLQWGQRFHQLGIAPLSAGNLSFRTERGFIITGASTDLNTLHREDLAEVVGIETDKARTSVRARGGVVPSRESLMHAEIYALKPEVNAIFHGHDRSVLSHAEELKLPVTAREQPAGSYALATEAINLLRSNPAINYLVLRNHGIIALGETPEAAGKLAETMNATARRQSG